jgi:hypothetical protein
MIAHRTFSQSTVVLSLSILTHAVTAHAQPYHVRAHTRVTTSGFGICDPQYIDNDTTRIQALSTSSGPFTATSSSCEDATSTAYGYSELGVLRGYVNYAASAANAPSGAGCQGTPQSWGDSLTFHSGSLPDGTPVHFEATLTFNRTLVGNGNGVIAQTSVAGPFGMSFSDSLAVPNPTQTVTANSSWFIGFPMAVEVSLYFEAAGTAQPIGGSVSGGVDVQSVVFTLKTTTPDTSYTTASGMSYVPLLDADVNVSGVGDGTDIVPFVAALLAESTSASDLYHADFNGSGIIDPGDVDGFTRKLVGL